MRKLLAVALAALTVSACTTTDPYTGEQKTSNTAKGAFGGAIAGAIVGALTNTSKGEEAAKNALIGAGVGALAGGAVGNYMDRQEQKLRAELEGTGVRVQRVGNDIILIMPGNVTFASDSADVNAQFYSTLNSVSRVLKEFNKSILTVSGHTDSTGADQYNFDLSQRRAGSVAQYLIGQGITAERFVVRGFGETRPVADNGTAQGRQQNRRVELQIAPLTQA